MDNKIRVGWIILGEDEKPYKRTTTPKLYTSFSKAKEAAKKIGVEDPSFAPVSFNPDAIVYSEYLGCPNWPNCDVVGCH